MVHRTIKKAPVLFLALMGASLLMLSSCYKDNEEDLYKNYYSQGQCDTVSVSFSSDIMPIIKGNCAISGCHVQGGTGPGIFGNYNGVMDKVKNGTFEKRVLIDKNMPPAAPLSDCQQSLIRAWLNAGSPNN